MKKIIPNEYNTLIPGNVYCFKHIKDTEYEKGSLIYAYNKRQKKFDDKGKLIKEEIVGDICCYVPENRKIDYNGEQLSVLERYICCGAFMIGEEKK